MNKILFPQLVVWPGIIGGAIVGGWTTPSLFGTEWGWDKFHGARSKRGGMSWRQLKQLGLCVLISAPLVFGSLALRCDVDMARLLLCDMTPIQPWRLNGLLYPITQRLAGELVWFETWRTGWQVHRTDRG